MQHALTHSVDMAWTSSSVCFPLPANLALLFLSRTFFLSLSSFSLTISTLLGWMPTLTVAPLAFSRWILSMWITFSKKQAQAEIRISYNFNCHKICFRNEKFFVEININVSWNNILVKKRSQVTSTYRESSSCGGVLCNWVILFLTLQNNKNPPITHLPNLILINLEL